MSRSRARRGLSRRHFLASVGASAALSPFVPVLNASGQEPRSPKRLLLFYTPDGVTHGTDWKPKGSERSFTLHDIHSPLDPHKQDIVVPWGLKLSAAGAGEQHAYGMGGLFTAARTHDPHGDVDFDGGNGHRTGWSSGPSIDQVVAEAVGPNAPYARRVGEGTAETPFRTLELGVLTGNPHIVARMIYKGDKRPIHPEDNPNATYERLFAAQPTDDTARRALQARQRGVLDLVHGEVQALRSRIGAEERHKLDAHLSGLNAIEQRLGTLNRLSCEAPAAPRSGNWWDGSENFPEASRLTIDMAVRALACDATRVASIQLSRGFSTIRHTWIGSDINHHSLSHNDKDVSAQERKVDKWYAEQFAYLLEQLKSVPEQDGTMLDNTLVLWGRELGTTRHRMEPAPFILAGRAGGALETGRFLSYSQEPHAKLLVSISNMMGRPTNSFGNLNRDSGPLAGL